MKKGLFVWMLLIVLMAGFVFPLGNFVAVAQTENMPDFNYVVFDEDGQFLFERIGVQAGDIYIDKHFNKYQVYMVDEMGQIARARFVETLPKPNITKKSLSGIEQTTDKKIALYLTHNDESYLSGDGTDSVFGKGGIHDIAKELFNQLSAQNVTVYLDETLHIPHDTLAYSRSRPTANKLLANDVNAIFDIHRDGASRSTYAKTTNGIEHSTVRIVVGQANPNYEQNLQLALYLLSVSESVCPWLFLDIYYAKGHYNQDLFEKALLFEMGTYTIEKELVMNTVQPLASVICTTLFGTTVDTTTGDLTIGGTSEDPTVDEVLATPQKPYSFRVFSSAIALLGLIGGITFFAIKFVKIKQKRIKI